MLELLFGQVFEAIYFALFMIFSKRIKTRKCLFIGLMIVEYLLLKTFLHYTVWFQISYTFITYIILKILYKEKAQVTDIFTFAIGSFLLIISTVPLYFIIYNITQNFIVFAIIARIILICWLFAFRNKLSNIQKVYKKIWNRNDKIKKKIKTTTFRCINVVIFNIMFYIINIIMLYCIYVNNK